MKSFSVIFTSALLLATISASCQTKENGVVLKASLKGSYNFAERDTCVYFLAELTLTNNTDTIYEFMSYNCFTSLCIVIDTNQVNICPNHCASNYPAPFKLKPKQTFAIPVILEINRKNITLGYSVRLGFVWMKPMIIQGNNFREELFRKRKVLEDVIWSNPINLKTAGGQSYEIY